MKTRIRVLILTVGFSLFVIAALPSLLLANQVPISPATKLSPQTTPASELDLIIIEPPQLITPLPIEPYQPLSFSVVVTNIGNSDIENLFFIDIFLDPQDVFTDHIPINQSSGFTAISSLASGQSRAVTITAPIGFTSIPTTHLIYAMADSLMAIDESNETNNISPPQTLLTGSPIPSSSTHLRL